MDAEARSALDRAFANRHNTEHRRISRGVFVTETALPNTQICNHELNRLLPMAAPAANLQQKLPYWLKRQPRAAVGPPSLLAANRNHRFPRNCQFIFFRNYNNYLPLKSAGD